MQLSTFAEQTEWTENTNFVHSATLTIVDSLISEANPVEARSLLLDLMRDASGDRLAAVVYYLAEAEWATGNLYEALRLFTAHYPIADHSADNHLKAKYNFGYATVCQLIYKQNSLPDFADKALEAYAGASYYYSLAGATDVAASAKNNEALLLAEFGRTDEARALLAEARELFKGRAVKLAQVDMSEAEICFKEQGKEFEAYRLAATAVAVFMENGETKLINDSTDTLVKAATDYKASQPNF